MPPPTPTGTWINTIHHVPTASKADIIAAWQADPDYVSHSEDPEDTPQTLWTLVGIFRHSNIQAMTGPAKKCPQCGAMNSFSSPKCSKCGSPLP